MVKVYEDGIPLKRKTAEFHTPSKDVIMCANATGFGNTLMNEGMPRMDRAISITDANDGVPA